MRSLVKTLLYSVSIAGISGLAACASVAPQPQLVVEPEQVTTRLAVAADRAANALDTLAAIEQVRTPTDLPPLAAGAPAELRRSVTVNWIGPADAVIKTLADRASYRFIVTGNTPAIQTIVNINARSVPVIEVLRDIGLQLSRRADLKVDVDQKTIELSYATVQIDEAE